MNKMNCFIKLEQKDTTYSFLPTGDIYNITYENFMINQFRGNVKDGSVNNIYLRIYHKDTIAAYPLLGILSSSTVSSTDDALLYEGNIEEINYTITFRPVNNIWFWNIHLEGTEKLIDFVYGQDIGIGNTGAVYSNELYMSQYLGHSVFEGLNGYVICSRQNMPNSDCFPYIQQGVIGAKAIHFSTDGLQYFDLSYKETNTPGTLDRDLQDINLQYEFAYIALQTEKIHLQGEHNLSFYGIFQPTHPDAVQEIEYQDLISFAYNLTLSPITTAAPINKITIKEIFTIPYSSPSFCKEEIDALFPLKQLEEFQDKSLLSFFTNDHAHVVTKEKELLTQRPHGTIIITPPNQEVIDCHLISSTQYMCGVFNSHVVIGNTDFHKFLSTPRGFLNILKNSGQRIYINLNGKYRLLSLPGLYEMGMNYSRWFYKLPEDVLTVTVFTSTKPADLTMEVSSRSGINYDYLITNQITMGDNEYDRNITYSEITDGLRFELDSDTYPGLHYDLTLPGENCVFSDDRIFFEEDTSFDETFLTISLKDKNRFQLMIRGYLSKEEEHRQKEYQFEEEKIAALKYYDSLINHFHLNINTSDSNNINILNETAWWYAHNAMIHFAMPHGLEQPGGAAWGTRDVCQGPMEFFLATQNYKISRNILLNLFSHQDVDTMEWPQWFMFDRYSLIADECHGDVIFWPLKSLADYLHATGDNTILEVLLPYHGAPNRKETLLQHIYNALSNIKQTRFINNTGLITYAGGDWDDTLQPAHEELKVKLVSSWTVALAYQTFTTLSEALKYTQEGLSNELLQLSLLVKEAFQDVLIKEGIIAGFLECSETNRHMLHPSDQETGIRYRLIPMTRSIIAELVDTEQANRNTAIIQWKLKCPDGVRLMDCPAHYDGGVSHLFKRAEQAANVGREISLQYTHAHIRYIEAMAKIGNAQEAWDSLFTINPILIQHHVPNANIRQSNLYFSSSDGAYRDRYEYEKYFSLLKTGDIEVKGGWRLYSSGPGIYFRQLVSNILGIRFSKEGLIIDPVLPRELNGLFFTYQCYDKLYEFTYQISPDNEVHAVSDEQEIPHCVIFNPYRSGGILIKEDDLKCHSHQITIYTKASN